MRLQMRRDKLLHPLRSGSGSGVGKEAYSAAPQGGAVGVALHEADRSRDKPTKRASMPGFMVLTLEAIEAALEWVGEDTCLQVGDAIFEQLGGLPMGLALSPVLARIYLDVKHDALWKRPLRAFPQLPTVQFFSE